MEVVKKKNVALMRRVEQLNQEFERDLDAI
jgi:hypothetical protein